MASSGSGGRPKPLPFQYQFAAGAIAGVSEILLLYPLDVVKTRLMLDTGKAGADSYNGMMDCFRKIIASEGVGRLYRGILPPIMVEAPKRATKFAANDFWGKTYRDALGYPYGKKPSQSLAVMTGASAGATESFVVVPFELVKIRLQDKAQAGRYNGTWDCCKQVFKNEGLLGFYQGFEATLWRHVFWNAGYFGCISLVRENLPAVQSKAGELGNNFVAGAVGGFVGTVLNTPFDVIKSRVQNSPKVAGSVRKYNWTFPSLPLVIREEGFGALYRGFAPKVLRLAPGGGVLLLVVEAVLEIFRKGLGPPYV